MKKLLNTLASYLPLFTCFISISAWTTTFVCLCISSKYTHRTTWWTIIFELIVITLSCGVFWSQTSRTYSSVVLCLIAISFSYATDDIDVYLHGDKVLLLAAAIGYITMLVIQFFWIFMLGTRQDDFALRSFREIPTSQSYTNHYKQQQQQQQIPQPSMNDLVNETIANTSSPTMPHPYTITSPSAHDSLFAAPNQMKDQVLGGQRNQNTIYISPNTEYILPVVAIHNYTANKEDPFELSFNKGEIMYVHEKVGSWWQAKKANGEVGMIPSNYVTDRN